MGSMDDFCNGTFWSSNLTWNGDWPQFTECFQNTVLVWISSGWIFLSFPFYFYSLLASPNNGLRISWKHILKLIFAVLQLIICVIEIISAVQTLSKEQQYWRAYLIGPLLEAISLILVIVLEIFERRKGKLTSGVLFIYWVLALTTYIIPFYSKIKIKEYDDDVLKFAVFYIYFGLTVFQVILHSIAETYPCVYHKICPEVLASFPSRLTFWWFTRFMILGYKKPITDENIFDLNPRDTTETAKKRFDAEWKKEEMRLNALEMKKHPRLSPQSNLVNYYINEESSSERTPLLSNKAEHKEEDEHQQKKPSLVKVLWKTFWWDLLHANLFKLLYDVLVFVNPQLLKLLIDFTENKGGEWSQQWKGFILAAAFFLTVFLQSILLQQVFFYNITLGFRVRAVLISRVYRKALTMDSVSRKASTAGEIVNLMSVDTEHLQEVMTYIWCIWSSPLQIGVALYFLYNTVSYSMFAGFGVLILMFPVNGFIMKQIQQLQEKQMEQKDRRIKLLTEILNGIKILKLYAWEMSFKDKIAAIRKVELNILWKGAIYNCGFTFCWTVAPYLVSLATFITFVYTSHDHYLDAQTAFVALSLFNILRFAMNAGPAMITEVVKSYVSLKRLDRYLQRDDFDEDCVSKKENEDEAVLIQNADFYWDKELGTCLNNINIRVPAGSLVAVVGQVGSGKSSLISAILGEMNKSKGYVNVKGTLAYVPQQAWIQNASLKDNILFGKNYKESIYSKIVDACALKPDLDMLPAGDNTEIGEKGINLSGGQKQRVSLARGVYFDSDIYLLDDPLSAVDSHVGKHVFSNVVGNSGLLKKKIHYLLDVVTSLGNKFLYKTRILITHGIQWLPKVDWIIVMNKGKISETGTYDELLNHAGAFAEFLQNYLKDEAESEDEDDPEVANVKAQILQRLTSIQSEDGLPESEGTTEDESGVRRRKSSQRISESEQKKLKSEISRDETKEEKPPPIKDTLIEEEKTEVGSVKLGVFLTYARSIGILFSLLIMLAYGLYQGSSVLSNVYISQWTADPILTNRSISNDTSSSVYMDRNNMYVGIYGGLGLAQALFITSYAVIIVSRTLKAAKNLHANMLHSILRSPMAFFDTTPLGRIINRFSLDTDIIDSELPMTFEMFLDCLFLVISTLVVISYSTPLFMVVIVPLGILYFLVQRFYIATSRQLKRIESKTRSPIYNHFGETLQGASVIRAFNVQDKFILESEKRVDHNQKYSFASVTSNRWLAFYLELTGNFVILAAAIFAVVSRGSDGSDSGITGSIVGLSISYALQITDNLNWFVRMSSELETKIVSVERVKEYSEVTQEDKLVYESHRPSLNWPSKGVVEFKNYSVRYRPGLDLVLKNISFTIKSGEKVGIVGRTGAGKSSLTLALFRLLEPASGCIVIDDENISNMGLHDCRSRLTILPQDPVLFSGSLRMNLDPLEQYADSDIWRALEHAHLKDYAQGVPGQLDYDCGEGGQNLSVGQRQLLCLARSLLRKTKILILDEATAAVDMETDDLIQKTIRTEFKECTVMTIAHRLNTIMDYDRIMVLDQGKISEFDTPNRLLANKDGHFYKLASDAGLV